MLGCKVLTDLRNMKNPGALRSITDFSGALRSITDFLFDRQGRFQSLLSGHS